MSAAHKAPTGGANAAVSQPNQTKSCWSCRILSGGSLILSGAYVFIAARRIVRQGSPSNLGTMAQITFAACLAAWGFVLIADPFGKSQRKT